MEHMKVVEICNLLGIDPDKLCELKIRRVSGASSETPTDLTWSLTVVTDDSFSFHIDVNAEAAT